MSDNIETIRALIRTDDLLEAHKRVDILISQDEYSIQAIALRAKISYKLKSFESAISDYNHLINLFPTNTEHISDRGLSYHMLGSYDEALNDFNKVIALEPENPYWFACRAFIKDYIKDFNGALEDYEMVLTLDPDDAIALNNKGLIEEKLGYMAKAQQSFEKADELQGVDLEKEIGHLKIPVEKKTDIPKKSTFKHFFAVLKNLFTSSQERQAFLSFLFKSKRK